MALTNAQYDSIMREYDNIRTFNRHIADARCDEVYALVPQVAHIDEQAAAISVDAVKARITGEGDSSDITDRLDELRQLKIQYLSSIGKPADYLDEIYTCRECKDTGRVDGKRCACFKRKAIDLVYRDSNLKNITADENFDNFSYEWYNDSDVHPTTGLTPLANMKKNISTIRDYLDNFDSTPGNILMYGDTGTGKTFLSNCIAKELLDTSHSVIYLTAIELFDRLSKKDYNRDSADDEPSTDYLTECDLLIIDDLGTEIDSVYTSSKLFYIINERLLRKKSVVISTNLSLPALRDVYSERIFSRLASAYRFICLYGDDIRTLKRKQR